MSDRVVQGAYFKDIMAQPMSLGALADSLESQTLSETLQADVESGKFKRIVLTGMGSSLHSLYPMERKLVQLGHCVHRIETAELISGLEPFYDQSTLLVTVSQSGESAETVVLLRRANEFGHVIGVTNDLTSSLGRLSDTAIDIAAGAESTVSCKTYLCTLAALNWLGANLAGDSVHAVVADLRIAQQAVAEYLQDWSSHVDQWRSHVEGIQSVFVSGRGDSLATAGTAGLILKESTRQHAEGMSSAAFRHGPLEMAGEKVLVVIVEGEGDDAALNHRLADDIRSGGGNAVLIGSGSRDRNLYSIPAMPHSMRPLVEMLPINMLSLAIAARDGIEAGRFQRASKITVIA